MYIAYVLGMALKWSPSEVNIATSLQQEQHMPPQGSSSHSLQFFYLLRTPIIGYLTPLIILGEGETLRLAFVGIVASMFAGFLGVMYFIIFRRVCQLKIHCLCQVLKPH